MALDVSTIATDTDLDDRHQDALGLDRARDPNESDFAKVRALALLDVLETLASRTPPITESDLADPTELKRAVVLRALELVFRGARKVQGDRYDLLSKDYGREYRATVSHLRPTVGGSQAGPGISIGISRR